MGIGLNRSILFSNHFWEEMINMTEREQWMLKRKQKRIRLIQIAKYIGCSISLLSRWECNTCEISKNKLDKYKQFIEIYKSD